MDALRLIVNKKILQHFFLKIWVVYTTQRIEKVLWAKSCFARLRPKSKNKIVGEFYEKNYKTGNIAVVLITTISFIGCDTRVHLRILTIKNKLNSKNILQVKTKEITADIENLEINVLSHINNPEVATGSSCE